MNIRRTKKLTAIGMLCALAYAAVMVGRIPIVPFFEVRPEGRRHRDWRVDFWTACLALGNGDCFRGANVHHQWDGNLRLLDERDFELFFRVYGGIYL